MELYAKMYAIVCHAVSQALDLLPECAENEPVHRILQEALYEAEEMYISHEESL